MNVGVGMFFREFGGIIKSLGRDRYGLGFVIQAH